ncbi:MAG: hypothetical protein WA888_12735 [Burkholderiaceae bacterium]
MNNPNSGRRRWLKSLLQQSAALGAGATGLPASASARNNPRNTVRFGLIGDVPYQVGDEDMVRKVMHSARREAQFLIHVGDFKSGAESCADQMLTRRLNLLNESPVPIIVVPGDNEWTDCSRMMTGLFDPLERLGKLRQLLAGKPNGFGRGKLTIERPSSNDGQRGFPHPVRQPEYMRWQAGPCLFVSLNITGSANGLTPHIGDDFNLERARHNTHWLMDSARIAQERSLAGLVIVLHADLQFHRSTINEDTREVLDRANPYGWVRGLLMRVTANFPGTVLLLNGDRHRFINDYPFTDLARIVDLANNRAEQFRWGVTAKVAHPRLARFTRVQSFGWPFTSHHVIIEATRLNTPPGEDPGLRLLVATRVLPMHGEEPDEPIN